MRKEDFTPDAPGKVVRTLDGAYWAFVPDPLPATIGLDEESIDLLVTAADAVGRLRGVGQTLPNPTLVSRPFARREAVLSSRIEGTTASVEDLLLFDAGAGDILAEPDDAREVSNHLAALSVGLDMIQRLPVCNRLICDVHAVL
jgi:Fic family protein